MNDCSLEAYDAIVHDKCRYQIGRDADVSRRLEEFHLTGLNFGGIGLDTLDCFLQ